jgi:hypothetical protein
MSQRLSPSSDADATLRVTPPRPGSAGRIIGIVVILAVAAGAVWMWRTRAVPAAPQDERPEPAVTPTPAAGNVGMPAPAELVRRYQGPVEHVDGKKMWLYQIGRAHV